MGSIVSMRDIPRALLRRVWIMVLVIAIGLPAALLYALSQPRLFEATAVIQIEAPQVAEGLTGQTTRIAANSQLDLIEQQLLSRDNLVSVIDRFELFPPDVPASSQVDILRASVSILKLIDSDQAWRPDVHPSGLVITVRLGDARKAADVANDLVESILAEAQRRADDRAARTLEFFIAEEDRLREQIERREADFVVFQEENAGSLPAAIAAQRSQLAGLIDARISIDQQLIELQSGSERLLAEDVTRRSALLNQQRELVQDNIAEIQAAIAAAPEVGRQLHAFERELEQLQNEYAATIERRSEAAMNQLLESRDQAERFEILETAIVPEFPVSTSRKKIAMAGGVLTLMAALGLALGLEMMDRSIRSASQLERELGIRPVVVIPKLQSRWQVRRMRLGLIGWLFALIALAATALRLGWDRIAAQIPFLQRSVPFGNGG